jgi:hypothetical protein
MKLIPISNDQLEIKESGVGSIIFGTAFAVIGMGVGILPFVSKSIEWWTFLVGLVFLGFGIFFALNATNRHIVLRRGGLSEITEKKIIGGKGATGSFPADQIISVRLDTNTQYDRGADGRSQRRRVSTLYVHLKDNSEVALAADSSGTGGLSVNGINLSSFGKAPLMNEAQQIADFFNVPLNTESRGAMNLQDVPGVINSAQDALTGMSNQQSISPILSVPSLSQPTVPQVVSNPTTETQSTVSTPQSPNNPTQPDYQPLPPPPTTAQLVAPADQQNQLPR